MIKKSLEKINDLSTSHWYWLAFIVGGLVLLLVALFYQFVMEELPCVLCIQIRLLISLFVLIGFLGLFSRQIKSLNIAAHISVMLTAIVFTERSYQLLGTERGFVFGDCGFSLGFPSWFAIEDWLPWLYRVETSCGYTPQIIFGITMADALMLLSVGILLLSVAVVVSRLIHWKK